MEDEAYADDFGDDDELLEYYEDGGAAEPTVAREPGTEAAAGTGGDGQTTASVEQYEANEAKQASKGKGAGPPRGIPAAYFEELSTAGAVAEDTRKFNGRGGPRSDGGGRGGRGGRGAPGAMSGRTGSGHVLMGGPRGLPPGMRPVLPIRGPPGGLMGPAGLPHMPNGIPLPLQMQMRMQMQMQMQSRLMNQIMAGRGGPRPAGGASPMIMHGGAAGASGRGGRGAAFGGPGGAAAGVAHGRPAAPLLSPPPPPPPRPPGPGRGGVGGRGGPRGPPQGALAGPPLPLPGPMGARQLQALQAAAGGIAGGLPQLEMLRQQMLRASAAGAAIRPMLANMAAAGLSHPAMAYMMRALQEQRQPQQQQTGGPGGVGMLGMDGMAAAVEPVADAAMALGRTASFEGSEDRAGEGPAGGPELVMPSIFRDGAAAVAGTGLAPERGDVGDGEDGAADGVLVGGLMPFSEDPGMLAGPRPRPPLSLLPPHLRQRAVFGGGQQVLQRECSQQQQQQQQLHDQQQQMGLGDESGAVDGRDSEQQQQQQQQPLPRQLILNPPVLRGNGPSQGSHLQEALQQEFFGLAADSDGRGPMGRCGIVEPQADGGWVQGYQQQLLQAQEGLEAGGGSSHLNANGQEEPWEWRQWRGDVELVGGTGGGVEDVDEAAAAAPHDGVWPADGALLAEAAEADPLNPGEGPAAAAGWGPWRPRAGWGPRAGGFRPRPLDGAAAVGAGSPAAAGAIYSGPGALSPTGGPAPRPAARPQMGVATHKWVREGSGAGAAAGPVAAAPGTTSSAAATAPAAAAAAGSSSNGVRRAAAAATSNSAPAAAAAAPEVVNSEVLKKTEDAIALMKRVIALEEARLKQQQLLKRKKAAAGTAWAAPAKIAKSAAGASAGAAAASAAAAKAAAPATAGPDGPSTTVQTSPPSAKRQKASAAQSSPAATAVRVAAGSRPPTAAAAALAISAPGAAQRNGEVRAQEAVQEPYAFTDDGTGLYDEGYEQNHQYGQEDGAAGAGLDAISAGHGPRRGGPGTSGTSGTGAAAEPGGGGGDGGRQGSGQVANEQDAAPQQEDEAEGCLYDDDDLLLSDDLPAELEGDEPADGTGEGETEAAGELASPAAAKRVREPSSEAYPQQQGPSTQRQRTS